MPVLPPVPDSVADPLGEPRFGAFSGALRSGRFDALSGRYRGERLNRLLTEKRWQYVCVTTPTLIVGAAIVHLGYLASAFVYAFDRSSRTLLEDRSFIVPPVFAEVTDEPMNQRAWLRRVRSTLAIDVTRGGGRLKASLSGGFEIDLALHVSQAPEPLTLVSPVSPRGMNVTQKLPSVPAEGEVRLGGATYKIVNGLALLDFTHGHLARETQWHWAAGTGRLADGRPVGLNLVAGFNEAADGTTENALWLDGAPSAVGRARFYMNEAEPMALWRIETDDGRVRLDFQPEGLRQADVDLKLVVSRYAQPIGVFRGTALDDAGRLVELEIPGITERHLARW